MGGGVGGWEPRGKGGGRSMGGRQRGVRNLDFESSRNQAEIGKSLQYCIDNSLQ